MSAKELHPLRGRRVGFLAGLSYPLRGARFVYVQHPRLRLFWLPPVLLTAGALLATTWLAIALHDDAVSWLWPEPTGEGFTALAARGMHRALEWLVAIALIALGIVTVALGTMPEPPQTPPA